MAEQPTSRGGEPGAEGVSAVAARCIDCGYDLQATPRDAACPECGLAVATSLNKSGSATLRGCFVAACRLYTVWLVVYSVQFIVSMVWMLVYWDRSRGGARQGAGAIEILTPVLLPLAVNGVASAVVWCLAPWGARMAIRRDRPLAIGAGMRAMDVFCVGLCLLGVWVMVNALLDIIFVATQGFEESRRYAADQFGTKVSSEELVTFLASIVVGVLLIHYGRRRLPAWPTAAADGVGPTDVEATDG